MSPEKLTNRQIASVFHNIADLLEIKGEVIYRILAYRRAAESLSDGYQCGFGLAVELDFFIQ